jgi:hypothetical protein
VLAEYGGNPASRAMTNAGHHRNSARTDLVHCPSIVTFIADLNLRTNAKGLRPAHRP